MSIELIFSMILFISGSGDRLGQFLRLDPVSQTKLVSQSKSKSQSNFDI